MADIAVELMLLPIEQEGCRVPVGKSYRPLFHYDNVDWDAQYEYDVLGAVPQGLPVTARLTFRHPQEHRGKLSVGMSFLLREDNRVIGYGRVTELLDLEISARKAMRRDEPVANADRPRHSTSNIVQHPARVSRPLRVSLRERRTPGVAFRHQRDEWIAFLREQAKQLRLWLEATRGFQRFTMFLQRQTKKLSLWFDASCDDVPKFLRQHGEKLRVWSAGIVRCLSILIGWVSLPMLIAWCWFAAAVLLISFAVHASTFLGIDPRAKWPGVMLIHLAVFPPFSAALYYASRAGGKDAEGQDRVFNSAPRWLRILTGAFFVYALVNFVIFLILCEGGGPHEQDGKFLLTSHSRVIREISEADYHRQQAYVVRGFSGHWMAFSCVALTMLVGTLKLRRRGTGAPAPTLGPARAPETANGKSS